MRQPHWFNDVECPINIYWLRKSLYGLKKAPHAWFQRFNISLLIFGFHLMWDNPYVFI